MGDSTTDPRPPKDRQGLMQDISEDKPNPSKAGWAYGLSEKPTGIGVDRKDVTGKVNPLLIPFEATKAFSVISDYGFKKYGNRDTWMHSEPEEGVSRYLAAGARHAIKAAQGEEIDPESGIPHVYAVLWNAAVVCWHYDKLKEREGK